MILEFTFGTNRNTKAYKVFFRSATFHISYETVVAATGKVNGTMLHVRRRNRWGPTTGKHLREMGCSLYTEVSDEEFEATCDAIIAEQMRQLVVQKLGA